MVEAPVEKKLEGWGKGRWCFLAHWEMLQALNPHTKTPDPSIHLSSPFPSSLQVIKAETAALEDEDAALPVLATIPGAQEVITIAEATANEAIAIAKTTIKVRRLEGVWGGGSGFIHWLM